MQHDDQQQRDRFRDRGESEHLPGARMAEAWGHVAVFKNNHPKLLVIDLDKELQIDMTEE